MPRVIGLKQRDAALGFFLRNLAENVLGKMVLELAERGHAIVDPIEQKQNADAGERAATEADEQTLKQAGADGDRGRSPFP